MDVQRKKIGIVDTTLRDAHQCLWATRMKTAHMLPVAEAMDKAGFAQIDLVAPIQFDVSVRYLKEDPWERVRLMRSKVQNTPLRFLVRSKNLMTFDTLPDDILELWVERAVANGFRIVGAFDGLNDVENILASTRVAKRLGSRRSAPCRTRSALSIRMSCTSRPRASWYRARPSTGSCSGCRWPADDRSDPTLVPAIKRVIGDMPLEIHSHCLTGLAPLVYLEAVKCGADILHTSIAPLANGAAQPATQSVARNLRLMGYDVPIDDLTVDHVGEHFRRIAEAEGKPVGEVLEYDAFHYQHQMPGGMLSNFKSQLAEAGLSDRFDQLLEEVARVREELGYPIMITPFAQLVGTQAVLNVVHGERYRVVPNEIKKYALGYYGKLLAPVAPTCSIASSRMVRSRSH